MVITLRKKLERVQDLEEFESCLRKLYNTTSGVCCQALLTIAYLQWRQKIRSRLLLGLESEDSQGSRLQDGVGGGLWKKEEMPLETYLPGFRLAYSDNECTVHQILPYQCKNDLGLRTSLKRKLQTVQEQEVTSPYSAV